MRDGPPTYIDQNLSRFCHATYANGTTPPPGYAHILLVGLRRGAHSEVGKQGFQHWDSSFEAVCAGFARVYSAMHFGCRAHSSAPNDSEGIGRFASNCSAARNPMITFFAGRRACAPERHARPNTKETLSVFPEKAGVFAPSDQFFPKLFLSRLRRGHRGMQWRQRRGLYAWRWCDRRRR